VLGKIRKPGASLDGFFPHIDWSADNDVYARLGGWSAVDKMFAHLGDLYRRHPPSGLNARQNSTGSSSQLTSLWAKGDLAGEAGGLPIANFSAGPTNSGPDHSFAQKVPSM
jgi:hypothetical protein